MVINGYGVGGAGMGTAVCWLVAVSCWCGWVRGGHVLSGDPLVTDLLVAS